MLERLQSPTDMKNVGIPISIPDLQFKKSTLKKEQMELEEYPKVHFLTQTFGRISLIFIHQNIPWGNKASRVIFHSKIYKLGNLLALFPEHVKSYQKLMKESSQIKNPASAYRIVLF